MSPRHPLQSCLVAAAVPVVIALGWFAWIEHRPPRAVPILPGLPSLPRTTEDGTARVCSFTNFARLTIRSQAEAQIEYELFVEGWMDLPFTVVTVRYPDRTLRITDRNCGNGALAFDGETIAGWHFAVDADGSIAVLSDQAAVFIEPLVEPERGDE
ncbi:hypothetical protein [Engelhardtia mirabilis]|uniref:Uncharacterized protein n=1 Tax=Engelhardtia mirabilis TaxID=2528011 RepID=A0A518BSU4_9BACT|nr:hypothetical protein Pla133_51660 [Planctomycetes bacterium Pla133]QDV04368.1 hypothetical protein Pla86_51630 [Planctomycetes bacterium Pla86]